MASAIIEAIVEEVIEESVETTVEETVEETVESSVEELVEETVEDTVEQTVEDAVETSVEDAVENAVEETVEGTVQKSIRQVIFKLIAGLVVGVLVITPIIEEIKKSTGAGKKKCQLDDATNAEMDKTTNVLTVLNELVNSWVEQLKKFKQGDDLGQVDYKGTKADAAGTVFAIFTDMKDKLNSASAIASLCAGNCEWKANMQQFKLDVLLGAYNVQAIFIAKDNASIMKQKNFPPEADRAKMTDAFNNNYEKDWIKIIKMNAKKNLTKAVQRQAKAASQAAVKNLITAPMTNIVKSGMNKTVVPDVKAQALAAARAQVTVVMNRYSSAIDDHLAIPVYGLATLKSWMEHHVKPTAVKEAKEKAKAACNATLQLPPAQIKIMNITSNAQKNVLNEYATQIKQVANQAADEAINKALEKEKKI